MRYALNGIGAVMLAVVGLSGCGGGGGTVDTRLGYSLQLTAERASLPVNVARIQPNIGGPYTATLYVKAQDSAGQPIPSGENVFACNIESGLETGALYYLDGKPEHERDETIGGETVKVPIAYRSVTLGATAGGASFHFHATDKPGTAVIRCAYTDPNGQIRQAATTVAVGGQPSGLPAQLAFHSLVPGYIFVQGPIQPTFAGLRVALVDEAGRPIAEPAAGVNNVRVRLVPTSTADVTATLTGVDANGQMVSGREIAIRSNADGVATLTLSSGYVPGTLVLEAVADRADNNVNNGISLPVFGTTAVSVVAQYPEQTALTITTTSLPQLQRRIPYAALLEASGGAPAYTWNLVSGSLPNGLTLNLAGVVSGTVTDANTVDGARPGTYNFVVEVRDRMGASVRKSLAITLID